MYLTNQFRNGLKIEYEGDPYTIVEFQHVKPGKGGAFVRTRLKNLLTGRVNDITFRSGDKVGKPDMDEKDMQFLYSEGAQYHFMDTNTYEQTFIPAEDLGDSKKWLLDGTIVKVLFYKGKAIDVETPIFVELEVTHTEPGMKGDTATGGSKPATLETGAVVQVPLFINEGERLRIDTRTGQYIERA